jgi:hypothetical protein
VTDAAATPQSDGASAPAGAPAPSDAASDPPGRDRLELVAALILALATVLAAWAAYQATRWSGEQSNAYSQAAARRTEAAQDTSLFAAEALVDMELFLSWLELQRGEPDAALEAFLVERFRDEFTPAFEAWLAQVPAGEIPPGTPFDMEEYRSTTAEVVMGLVAEADALTEEARRANQLADNFVLVAVIMAMVLFFAGVVTHFHDRRLRQALLGLAVVLLVGGIGFMLGMPQSVAV